MNPATFVPIDIPAKKVAFFKPSIYLNFLEPEEERKKKKRRKQCWIMVRISDVNRQKAIFEQYTVFDIDIVKIVSKYGLYLIGGTALDLLCNYHSVPFWRNRSNNDFDYWTSLTINKIQMSL